MLSKTLTSAMVALAATGFVSAQTFTDCNPMEKDCPDDEAIGKNSVDCEWTSECKVFEALPGTTLNYGNEGAIFSIKTGKEAPTAATHKRIFFGKVEVELQAAEGQGIVTAIVLESQNLDEIDWEFVGGDNAQVQSNYFGKGDDSTYDRVIYHDVDTPLTSTHIYGIEYTREHVKWFIDGAEVRTLKYADAKGGSRFPQTPMEVKIGTWPAGNKDTPEGTVEWAGGYTDYSKGPFNAYYKSVTIVDYAGGNAPTTDNIDKYVWTDRTGSWESIKVVKGDGSSSGGDDDEEDKETKSKSKTEEPSSKTKSKTSAEPTTTSTTSTPSSTPTPTVTETVTTPSSTTEDSETSTTSEDDSEETGDSGDGEDGEDGEGDDGSAASGLFASFSRVAAAGVAAVVVAQLF